MEIQDAINLGKLLVAKHIPQWSFRVDSTRVRAGQCRYDFKEIGVSREHINLNKLEIVRETILHEIAHALTPGHEHDETWKNTLIGLGGSGEQFYNGNEVKMPGSYEGHCSCNTYRRDSPPDPAKKYHCRNCGQDITWNETISIQRPNLQRAVGSLHTSCQICGKIARVESTMETETETVQQLKCGHLVCVPKRNCTAEARNLRSLRGQSLYEFQITDGVQFLANSGFNACLLFEMGLGKTIVTAAILKLFRQELGKTLIVCKKTLKIQWFLEIANWAGIIAQVFDGSSTKPDPMFDVHIKTFDYMWRNTEENEAEGYQTVIIDEVQLIKNSQAKRTDAVRRVAQGAKHVMCLSGRPIKNHAGEYFVPLNLVNPQMFPAYTQYIRNHVVNYQDGWATKLGGLKDPKGFIEATKSFIIYRSRDEVMPDLPKIRRTHTVVEMGAEVAAKYLEWLKKFEDEYDEGGAKVKPGSNILGYMAKMRYFTGLAKMEVAIERAQEFLEETDRKITLFVHHKDVGRGILLAMQNYCKDKNISCIEITSEQNEITRHEMVKKFTEDPNCRVLVASTQASGEGLNLQVCSDSIFVERQWEPSTESQAESRFVRIGSTAESVAIDYLVAAGTIDEFLSELVEKKREIVEKTVKGEAASWQETSIMQDLADMLRKRGRAKWRV